MQWLISILGPAGPVLVGLAAVILLILRPFRSRRLRQREATADAASRLGMTYQPPRGDGGKGAVDEGSHRFAGETDGVAWALETVMLADQPAGGDAPSLAPRCYSRWTTRRLADRGATGEYLLLMSLAGVARPAVRPGVLEALLDKMARLTLFLTVRSYFGEDRAGGLALRPGDRRSLGDEALDQRYMVFCNSRNAPERLADLAATAAGWLLDREAAPLAILWDEAGLAVSAPGGRLAPADVAAFAQGGVDLVKLLSAGRVPCKAVASGAA